jgi:hypothetical protein
MESRVQSPWVSTRRNRKSQESGMGSNPIRSYSTILYGFWIGCLDLLTPYTQCSKQRSRWSTQFTIHRYTRTRILSLHQSLLGNSCPQWLFLCNVFTKRFVACWLTLHNWTLNCLVAPIVKITPRHGPHRKHSLSIVEACLPHHCIATVAARST